MSAAPTIRGAVAADLAAITDIYADAVLNGTASWEIEPPAADEMARRRDEILSLDLPYIVAELPEGVAGYAYAGRYRPRPAYVHTVENSVYVAPWARRRGVGAVLLDALIEACRARGKHQMVAVIGDSVDNPSIALHERAGFVHAGLLRNVGYKHGRWLDQVLMQKTLVEE